MAQATATACMKPLATFNSMPAEVKLRIIEASMPDNILYIVSNLVGKWMCWWSEGWITGLLCVSKDLSAIARPAITARLIVRIIELERLKAIERDALRLKSHDQRMTGPDRVQIPNLPPFVASEARKLQIRQSKTSVMLPFDDFDISQLAKVDTITYLLYDIPKIMQSCCSWLEDARENKEFEVLVNGEVRNNVYARRTDTEVWLREAMCYAVQATQTPKWDVELDWLRVMLYSGSLEILRIRALIESVSEMLTDPRLGAKFVWFLTCVSGRRNRLPVVIADARFDVLVEYQMPRGDVSDSDVFIKVKLDKSGQEQTIEVNGDGVAYEERFENASNFDDEVDLSSVRYVDDTGQPF